MSDFVNLEDDFSVDGPSPPSKRDRVAFPGSFNPPTVGHLAIAEAAWTASGATGVDLVVSSVALGKESTTRPTMEHRLEVLESIAATRPWLDVTLSDLRLLADLAAGYGWLLIGADKWTQINELQWYDGSTKARDAALRRLPRLIVVGREGHGVPADATLMPADATLMDVPDALGVSSTAVREGDWGTAAPEARIFAERTGAWIDPNRYERFIISRGRP